MALTNTTGAEDRQLDQEIETNPGANYDVHATVLAVFDVKISRLEAVIAGRDEIIWDLNKQIGELERQLEQFRNA